MQTRRSKLSGLARKEAIAGYMFILPWILGFLMFTSFPLISSFILSFTNYSVINPPKFCGTENYKIMFTSDRLFYKSLGNTFYMVAIGVPLNILVGLSIALLLNTKVRGMQYYRTIFYLPSIVPTVASSILWLWILHPSVGLLNSALHLFGVNGPQWLASPIWSKPAIILMGLWGAGSSMIIYLAGLQGIPEQLYEAAEIDGATWWTKFFKITLPLLSPTIFFNLVMGIIGTMQIFTQAYIMTQGGPLDSTLFYVYYLFNNAFSYFKMGYACSLAWFLFLIILVLTLIQLRLARYWVYYEVL
jgi:multiple sugar transport system permease protein